MKNPILKSNNPSGENNLEVPVVNFPPFNKQPPKPKQPNKDWVLISGVATSQVRSKTTSDTPAYIFLRINNNKHSQAECADLACRNCEIPVIFRIKQEQKFIKPTINKGDNLTLTGYFADVDKPRPSFTAYNYQNLTISHHE